jgi:hypothetical protein
MTYCVVWELFRWPDALDEVDVATLVRLPDTLCVLKVGSHQNFEKQCETMFVQMCV